MTASSDKNKKRLIVFFLWVCILCTLLSFRLGWIQIVNADYYAKIAVERQTQDVSIEAQRGNIYDRNGNELAISAATNTVFFRPAELYGSGDTEDQKEVKREKTARVLAEILEMDKDYVKELMGQEKAVIRIAKYVDKEVADQLRAAMADEEIELRGVLIDPAVRRYYPQGSFLAHVLGGVQDDNVGLSGIERYYDQYLSGTPGRKITSTDVGTNSLSYGIEKYYNAEDGLGVVLTIDEMIQHYVEQAIEQVAVDTQAKRVYCIAMDPKTGEILAMASTPGFDPNNPKVPLDPDEAAMVAAMSPDEQFNYWNSVMWRNPMVSDTFDPGSTFKLLTTAIALEEGKTYPNERFVCTGSIMVSTQQLNCWSKNPHGDQTLVQAVGNSCNPVFVTLAGRIELPTFFDYMEKLGMTEKTGIDYPGEANNILQKRESAGPVGLATMSYGQGIAVTPISLITAFSTLGNDGILMEPHLVKALVDSDGNVVHNIEPKEVRRVFSSQTVAEMANIMEMTVDEGGGMNAQVAGYRVGGKTGTAQKVVNNAYSNDKLSPSFVGMAPMDDPQIAILLVVDEPDGVQFGSQAAAPGVQMILKNVLLHMGVQPDYTLAELKEIHGDMVAVPSVVGMSYQDAAGLLESRSLSYSVSPAFAEGEEMVDFVVVDQYPKAGEKKPVGDVIYLYRE